jgi:putative transposase
MDELIPWLYLKRISANDFPKALQLLLGTDAKGLSASTITGLKPVWEDEYAEWSKRSLAGKRYVYLWADGIYCNRHRRINSASRSVGKMTGSACSY